MRYWVLISVVFAALLVGLGEILVFAVFLTLPFIGWRSGSLPIKIGTLLVAIAGLFLHSQGYKLFGSAQIVATPRLEGAVGVTGIEPPNLIRFASGKASKLQGVYFPRAVDLTAQNEQNIFLWHLLGEHSPDAGLEVYMDEAGQGKCLVRNQYWCGNTFFPTALPQRLPSHKCTDFGVILVEARLALPSGEMDDHAYEEHLLDALDRSLTRPVIMKRGDEAAVALGTQMIDPGSRRFVAGAYLLIAAQDVEAYPAIEREIRRRQQRNRDDYDAIAQTRSSDLDTLLAWIDVDEARRRILATPPLSSTYQMGAASLWGTNAAILASHGDLSGFEQAIRMISDKQLPESARRELSSVIPLYFKWPAESPLFLNWYAGVRARLRTGRDEFGAVSFWLDEGKPFDEIYRTSIDQVAKQM